MSGTAVRRRPGGRSARNRRSVLDATLALLAETGVDGLTVAEVAARAGVHETSIRRRWHTRENLVCDALLGYSAEQLPVPDTGSLREDLTVFATEVAAYDSTPLGRALLHAAVMTTENAAFAEARDGFWQTRYELASVMITRAAGRGEIAGTVDPRLVLEAIIAPLHFRTLLTGELLEEDLPGRLVELALEGIQRPRR